MSIPYLLLVHPTCEEQCQRDEDHRQRGLKSSKEEQCLQSDLGRGCGVSGSQSDAVDLDDEPLTLGGRKTSLYAMMANSAINVQRKASRR
jgi:hypothetical protein